MPERASRRLERECQRNIVLIWLTGQLAPDFKTIADFRKDNGKAIGEVCRTFVALCRELELLSEASVAIDGSKFKAVNARYRNFTEAKMKRRLERIEESIARYMAQLETADRHGERPRDLGRAVTIEPFSGGSALNQVSSTGDGSSAALAADRRLVHRQQMRAGGRPAEGRLK